MANFTPRFSLFTADGQERHESNGGAIDPLVRYRLLNRFLTLSDIKIEKKISSFYRGKEEIKRRIKKEIRNVK